MDERDSMVIELTRLIVTHRVYRLQSLMNARLKDSYGPRIMWGTMRKKIQPFSQYVLELPEFQEFRDLTVGELLTHWGDVAAASPDDVLEALGVIEGRIKAINEELSGEPIAGPDE